MTLQGFECGLSQSEIGLDEGDVVYAVSTRATDRREMLAQ
jgi:hypothetical protein